MDKLAEHRGTQALLERARAAISGTIVVPTADLRALLSALTAATARAEALEKAIRWALGYDEGEPQFPGPEVRMGGRVAPYGWRSELRRRAAAFLADGEG